MMHSPHRMSVHIVLIFPLAQQSKSLFDGVLPCIHHQYFFRRYFFVEQTTHCSTLYYSKSQSVCGFINKNKIFILYFASNTQLMRPTTFKFSSRLFSIPLKLLFEKTFKTLNQSGPFLNQRISDQNGSLKENYSAHQEVMSQAQMGSSTESKVRRSKSGI